jgi:hypothetical protein
MRKRYSILIFSLLTLTGCTSSYIVNVNGALKSPQPVPAEAHIMVLVDPNAKDPVFENSMRTRIEMLLRDDGYQAVDNLSAADYRLGFNFGVGHHEETSYQSEGPVFGRHEVDYFVPHEETIWDQWLRVKLYREDTIVWDGTALTSDGYPEEKKSVNYLLVALFEYFGKDSHGRKAVTIDANDPRIAALGTYPK